MTGVNEVGRFIGADRDAARDEGRIQLLFCRNGAIGISSSHSYCPYALTGFGGELST